jgi:hypothetical protein
MPCGCAAATVFAASVSPTTCCCSWSAGVGILNLTRSSVWCALRAVPVANCPAVRNRQAPSTSSTANAAHLMRHMWALPCRCCCGPLGYWLPALLGFRGSGMIRTLPTVVLGCQLCVLAAGCCVLSVLGSAVKVAGLYRMCVCQVSPLFAVVSCCK